MSDRAARYAIAMIAVVLGALVWAPAPAQARAHAAEGADGALCPDAGGVSVVVDFKDLGGGVQQACVEDGAGKTASDVFTEAGHDLTPVGAFPGAACQVDGKPADVACAQMPPADAYWGLYVGQAGKWGYAPKGADELTMADGDFVGFAWQSTKTSSPPEVAPVAAPASASSDEPASAAPGESDTEEDDDDGAPWWIAAAVVVLLGAAGAAVAVRRRRT
jgi:hypothetical protein